MWAKNVRLRCLLSNICFMTKQNRRHKLVISPFIIHRKHIGVSVDCHINALIQGCNSLYCGFRVLFLHSVLRALNLQRHTFDV